MVMMAEQTTVWEQSVMRELATLADQPYTLPELVDHALDKAYRLLDSEIVVLYLYQPQRHQLLAYATQGIRLNRVQLVLSLPQPAIIANGCLDVLDDPLLARYPVKTELRLPLQHGGVLFGWFYVARLKKVLFKPHEETLYHTLAHHLATGLARVLPWQQSQSTHAPVLQEACGM